MQCKLFLIAKWESRIQSGNSCIVRLEFIKCFIVVKSRKLIAFITLKSIIMWFCRLTASCGVRENSIREE
jgi:hypothetical protein